MNNLMFISLTVCLILSKTVQADIDSEFILAALDDTSDRVKALFEKGANISASDEDGQTALMKASRDGCLETVKFLIENGADVNAKDKNGKTPLMFASAFDRCRVQKLLIDSGADVNANDNGGWSALIYAAYDAISSHYVTTNKEIIGQFTARHITVRLLLRNGANADYAIQYALRSLVKMHVYDKRDVYVGPDTITSCVSGYDYTYDIINANNTFWERLTSYFDCIL